MGNYGRGWGDGYGHPSSESQEAHWDREAMAEGDWEWLSKSPRQEKLRREQGITDESYVDDQGDRPGLPASCGPGEGSAGG